MVKNTQQHSAARTAAHELSHSEFEIKLYESKEQIWMYILLMYSVPIQAKISPQAKLKGYPNSEMFCFNLMNL